MKLIAIYPPGSRATSIWNIFSYYKHFTSYLMSSCYETHSVHSIKFSAPFSLSLSLSLSFASRYARLLDSFHNARPLIRNYPVGWVDRWEKVPAAELLPASCYSVTGPPQPPMRARPAPFRSFHSTREWIQRGNSHERDAIWSGH